MNSFCNTVTQKGICDNTHAYGHSSIQHTLTRQTRKEKTKVCKDKPNSVIGFDFKAERENLNLRAKCQQTIKKGTMDFDGWGS